MEGKGQAQQKKAEYDHEPWHNDGKRLLREPLLVGEGVLIRIQGQCLLLVKGVLILLQMSTF